MGLNFGKLLKSIAPIAGTLLGGPVGGALGGALGGLADNAFGKGRGVGNILGGAARGGAMGLVGRGLNIGNALNIRTPGALGSLAQRLGSSPIGRGISNTFAPRDAEGNRQLDLGRVISSGGAISDIIGTQRQRRASERYTNAQTAQRNELMSRILAPRDYNLPPTGSGY